MIHQDPPEGECSKEHEGQKEGMEKTRWRQILQQYPIREQQAMGTY